MPNSKETVMLEYQIITNNTAKDYCISMGTSLRRGEILDNISCVVCLRDGDPIGLISFDIIGETCTIHDFTVLEKFRGLGVGRLLYYKLIDYLRDETDVDEIQVIFIKGEPEGTTYLEMLHFAKDTSDKKRAEFVLEDALSSKYLSMPVSVSEDVKVLPLSEYDSPECIKKLDDLFDESPWYLTSEKVFTDSDKFHSVVLLKNDIPCGFALLNTKIHDVLQITYLYVSDSASKYSLNLIQELAKLAGKDYRPKTRVICFLATGEARQLAEKIVTDLKYSDYSRYYIKLIFEDEDT